MSKEHFKGQAARLAAHLANKHGVKLRPAATLEAVAALHGARDWNTLVAGLPCTDRARAATGSADEVSAGEALFQQILATGAEDFSLWVVGYESPLTHGPGIIAGKRVRVRELKYSANGLRVKASVHRELGAALCEFLEQKAKAAPISFESGTGILGAFDYKFGDKVHEVRYWAMGRHNHAKIVVDFADRPPRLQPLEFARAPRAKRQSKGELHLMPAGIRQDYCFAVARDLKVTDLRWAGARWTQVNPSEFGEAELWFIRVDTPEEVLACEALVLAGHRVLARVAGETVAEAIEQLERWGFGADRLQRIVCGVWGLPRIAS